MLAGLMPRLRRHFGRWCVTTYHRISRRVVLRLALGNVNNVRITSD